MLDAPFVGSHIVPRLPSGDSRRNRCRKHCCWIEKCISEALRGGMLLHAGANGRMAGGRLVRKKKKKQGKGSQLEDGL